MFPVLIEKETEMGHNLFYEQRDAPASIPDPCPSTFELKIAESGQMVFARVDGPLDSEHAAGFLTWMQPLCRLSRRIVLDLRRAAQVDASGVRALLHLQQELELE